MKSNYNVILNEIRKAPLLIGALLVSTWGVSPIPLKAGIEAGIRIADRQVKGKVIDENGEGLPGVNVMVKGTQTGTNTDLDGTFTLNVPDVAGTVLVFSFVGYLSQEIVVGTQNTINVSLNTDTKALEEVVVVGYGSQLKREVTGSVQTVKSSELKDIPVSQVILVWLISIVEYS